MVIRHTSTSFATMLRGMAATVRVAATRPLERAAHLRHAVLRTLEAASARTVSHAYKPHRLTHVIHQAKHAGPTTARFVTYGNTSRTFARAGYRPSARMPRGPAVPATVGLGAARNFATAPATGTFQSGVNNVPVVLRAFAQIFDDENLSLPKGTRYAPYLPRKARKSRTATRSRARQCVRRDSAASTASAVLRELGHYFPVVIAPVEEEVALPLQPEKLVTPGYTATLALPLAPSLSALLEPTASVPYADAEIGIAVLARLTHGLLPLHEAYSAAGARIIPLLAKLESLGVLDINAYPTTTLDVVADHRGDPDILRIVFSGRAVQDVRDLLGDALGGEEWWGLSHARQVIIPLEEDEAKGHWDEPTPAEPSLASSTVSDLIMPTLDMSFTPTVVQSAYNPDFDYDSDAAWPSPGTSVQSSPSSASGMSTPYSLTSSWESSSLVSSLSELDQYDREWISPPSEADADLDAWSDAGIEPTTDADRVEEVEMFWVGGGLSLTQSW